MRRSTLLVFIVLGAALAALAFSFGVDRVKIGDDVLRPSVAAGPQSATLGWREVYGSGPNRIVFEVERLDVTPDGWRAHLAVTNETSVSWGLGDPQATLDREFGLKLFTTGDLDELERGIGNGTLPATRTAQRYEPSLPKLLTPDASWRGTISAPGSLAAGRFVRVVFGTLLSVGKPPEGMSDSIVWITDHAYELQR
jgi:hypothetical protein